MRNFLRSNYQIIFIILLAFFFRFWQIGSLPGGLFPDEAANGLDVNSILKGDLRPFYERGNGREALFFYALALAVSLFGRGPWQHHIVSGTFGVLEVLAAYFLAKRLFDKRVALLSSFFMAVSSFAVTLSRTAFRANTLPLFTTLTLLFVVKFLQTRGQRQKTFAAIGAGLSFGLGFYTYISYRMMIALGLTIFGIFILVNRGKIAKILAEQKRHLAVFGGAFLLAFSWIGFYFVTHPNALFARVGHVSIFSKDLNQGDALGTFWRVLKATILGFFVNGDLNWRHNVSGYPFLTPILSPFFAAGLLIFTVAVFVVLKQAWDKRFNLKLFSMALLALLFWLMLVPEITTAEGIPHGLRLVGVIPAIFILPAWAMNELWQRLKAKSPFGQTAKKFFAGIILSTVFVYNFSLYFIVAAESREYYYAFRSDLTAVSDYLKSCPKKGMVYLSLDKFSVQTVDYLTSGYLDKFYLLDPATTYEVTLRQGDRVIFTQSTLYDRILFLQYHPQAKLIIEKKNKFGELIMLVYEQK